MIFGRICRALLAGSAMLGTPALAQDRDWAGFYVGVDAGMASGRLRGSGADDHSQLSNVVVPGRGIVVVPATSIGFTGSDRRTDFVYGGLAGAQWQTGSVILGIEGDLHGPRDMAAFAAAQTVPATILAPASNSEISRSARSSYDWSIRGRLGFDLGRNMLYAAGGIVSARVRLNGTDSFTTPAGAAATGGGIAAFNSPAIGPVVVSASERATMTGWTAGVGGEHRLSRRLGIGLDARYNDYGSRTFALAESCSVAAVAQGQCANASRTSPPIVVNGATLNPATDVTPGTVPGSTRVSLNEWRLTARLIFAF